MLGGFAGQLSLGHAGFFGLGAYTSSLLYVDHGVSPWIGMVVGTLLSGLLALLVGYPTFRLRGPYYSMATLALGIILLNLAVRFVDITRGPAGLSIPFDPSVKNMMFAESWPFVIIAGGYLAASLLVSIQIKRSRLGYQLAAVREDEEAARALGVDATRVKLVAAVLSGALAGGVGTIYAQYILFLTPESVLGVTVSIQIIVFAIVGGAGSIWGPVFGALLLVPIGQIVLRDFGGSLPGVHTLVYGAVVIAVVLLAPQGVFGLIRQGAYFASKRLWRRG